MKLMLICKKEIKNETGIRCCVVDCWCCIWRCLFVQNLQKSLKINFMKKETIVIAVAVVGVSTLLYLSFAKYNQRDITNDSSLKKDYDMLMKKIEEAKK